MTINIADNSPRVNYTATSGQTVFTVSFEFFEDADLSVYINGTEKTITTHYTVSGGDGSTGTVTLTSGATAGDKVAIVRDVSLQRTSDFTEGAAISRAALNEQLDIITAQIADVDDKASRALQLNDHEVAVSITLPATDDRKGKILGFNASTGAVEAGPTLADTQSLADVSADIATLADIEDGTDATDAIQTVASISSNVSTVAGISANVTTVASISSNVTAVAADATDIGTVAGSISNVNTVAGIDSNITTVAGNTTNINTVAGNNSNISTVAGISDNITTVAGISSNVTTVAGISVSVPTVAGVASNVTTVANNISDVNTVATNIGSITTKVSKSGDTMTGNLEFDDDVKAIFGTRNSLQIFHDATAITASNIKLYFTNGSTSGTMEITDSDHTVSVSDVVRVDSPEILNSTPVSVTGVVQSSLQQDLTVSAVTSTTFTVPVTYASDPGSTGFLEQAGTYYYYTGTSKSYISEQSVGPLNILTSELNVYNAAETSQLAQFSTSASKLFHNNSQKLATTSSGISVTGGLTVSGDLTVQGTTITVDSASAQSIDLGDGDKMRFGDSNDAYIEWNTVGYFDVRSTGRFDIKSEGNDLRLVSNTNTGLTVNHTGGTPAVHLYNSGTERLATTSTGIDVTGTVTADGLTVDGLAEISASNTRINLYETDTTDKNTQLQSSNSRLMIKTLSDDGLTATERLRVDHSTGDVSFYEDTGTTPKFFWDASAESLGIGTSSPARGPLHLHSSSGNAHLHMTTTSSGATASDGLTVFADASLAGLWYREAGSLQFATNSTERMRIDSSGNLLLGTSAHAGYGPLQVGSTSTASTIIQMLAATNGYNTIHFGDATSGTGRYAGFVQYNHTDDKLFLGAGSATRATIDSSGNVGIGISDPSSYYAENLVVKAPAEGGITIRSNATTDTNYLMFADGTAGTAAYRGYIGYSHNSPEHLNLVSHGFMRFYTADPAVEAMRLDASGNLLVGKTSASISTAGFQANTGGDTYHVVDGGITAYFNRLTSNGDIVQFRKDGTTVGSIGNAGTALLFENPNANSYLAFHANNQSNGIFYQDGTTKNLAPYTARTNEFDLGNSGGRWKDLYLSGGVYLGGTGAANKLDDYEEGTWTPAVAAGSISGTSITYTGTYRKIGSIVLIRFQASNTTGDISVSSYVAFSGLPFACNMTATSTVTTEDIDQFDRQGFAQMGSSTLTLSNCGSTSGTTALSVSIVGHTA